MQPVICIGQMLMTSYQILQELRLHLSYIAHIFGFHTSVFVKRGNIFSISENLNDFFFILPLDDHKHCASVSQAVLTTKACDPPGQEQYVCLAMAKGHSCSAACLFSSKLLPHLPLMERQ